MTMWPETLESDYRKSMAGLESLRLATYLIELTTQKAARTADDGIGGRWEA